MPPVHARPGNPLPATRHPAHERGRKQCRQQGAASGKYGEKGCAEPARTSDGSHSLLSKEKCDKWQKTRCHAFAKLRNEGRRDGLSPLTCPKRYATSGRFEISRPTHDDPSRDKTSRSVPFLRARTTKCRRGHLWSLQKRCRVDATDHRFGGRRAFGEYVTDAHLDIRYVSCTNAKRLRSDPQFFFSSSTFRIDYAPSATVFVPDAPDRMPIPDVP
jgi:hypothetical protein